MESLELKTTKMKRSRLTTGNLKPTAVVVREPDRIYTFDIDSRPAQAWGAGEVEE